MRRRSAALRAMVADRTGAAMVEFALILPILIMLTFGIVDFGRYFWTLSTVENAAREGARYASVRGATSDSPATVGQVTTYLLNRTVIDQSRLTVAVAWQPNNAPGNKVNVQLTYAFNFIGLTFLPKTSLAVVGSSTMTILQ